MGGLLSLHMGSGQTYAKGILLPCPILAMNILLEFQNRGHHSIQVCGYTLQWVREHLIVHKLSLLPPNPPAGQHELEPLKQLSWAASWEKEGSTSLSPCSSFPGLLLGRRSPSLTFL